MQRQIKLTLALTVFLEIMLYLFALATNASGSASIYLLLVPLCAAFVVNVVYLPYIFGKLIKYIRDEIKRGLS